MPDHVTPQPVPINAKFDDDFVTQLVVVLDTDTMREVAARVAQHVVGKRLPKRDADMVVRYQGRVLSADMTVAEAGIAPLQNVYVDWVEKEERHEECCGLRVAHVRGCRGHQGRRGSS